MLPKALNTCPKSNKSPNLVTLFMSIGDHSKSHKGGRGGQIATGIAVEIVVMSYVLPVDVIVSFSFKIIYIKIRRNVFYCQKCHKIDFPETQLLYTGKLKIECHAFCSNVQLVYAMLGNNSMCWALEGSGRISVGKVVASNTIDLLLDSTDVRTRCDSQHVP